MKNAVNGPDIVVGSITFQPIHSPNIGWECPKCHKIHSPNTTTCDCNRTVRNNMESHKALRGSSNLIDNLVQQLNEG